MLQAWFDDSGKAASDESPVYLLAGFVGSKKNWEAFSDVWQRELERKPQLTSLHAVDAYALKGQFKGWHREDRDNRLLRFVEIIRKHVSSGTTFVTRHRHFRVFSDAVATLPIVRNSAEYRLFKNPYFLGFNFVLGATLALQARKRTREMIEILFDEGIDNRRRLEYGFSEFINTVTRRTPQFLDLLINKKAEFRDDEKCLPLQAADLLAWHVRRLYYEVSRGNKYDETVWLKLVEATNYNNYWYGPDRYKELLDNLRARKFPDWSRITEQIRQITP